MPTPEQIYRAGAEAMRAEIVAKFERLEFYVHATHARNTPLPEMPPALADSSPLGTHIPGSPHRGG